jgi:hypothetical protein
LIEAFLKKESIRINRHDKKTEFYNIPLKKLGDPKLMELVDLELPKNKS